MTREDTTDWTPAELTAMLDALTAVDHALAQGGATTSNEELASIINRLPERVREEVFTRWQR